MKNATRNFLKCNVRVVYIFCCLLDNKNIKTNKEDMMKKIVTLGILMICLLVAVRMTTFANAESIEEASFVDADDVVDEKNVERGDSGIIEDMLIECGIIASPVRNGELYNMPTAKTGKCNELPVLQGF